MTGSPERLVAKGQLSLWVLLALCIGLHPGLVLKRNESGLSNYGVHLKTVVPYSLALGLGAVYSLRAARQVRARDRNALSTRKILYSYAFLLGLSLVSTYVYKLDNVFNDLHVGANIATACFETVTGIWMALVARSHREMPALLAFELTGFILGALTVAGTLHLVLVAEVLIGVGFGLLLYRSTVYGSVAPRSIQPDVP